MPYYFWRLVQLGRKFLLAVITVLCASNAMFQATCALGVLALAYGLHAEHKPFLEESDKNAHRRASSRKSAVAAAAPGGARSSTALRRASVFVGVVAVDAVDRVADSVASLLDFNLLETVLLSCSFAILMAGMVFQSAQFPPGSNAYVGLTVLVFLVFFCAVCLFVRLVFVEVGRTCRPDSKGGRAFAPAATIDASRRRGGVHRGSEDETRALVLPDVAAASWTDNPIRKQNSGDGTIWAST